MWCDAGRDWDQVKLEEGASEKPIEAWLGSYPRKEPQRNATSWLNLERCLVCSTKMKTSPMTLMSHGPKHVLL